MKNLIHLFFLLILGSFLSAQPAFVDSTFGTNGTRTIGTAGSAQDVNAAVLLPDGKIVMGGYSSEAGQNRFMFIRLTSNGNLDNTFGASGMAFVNAGALSEAIRAMALQPDGKIVAAGYADVGGGAEDFALVRILENGNPDPDFGTGGIVTTDIDGRIDLAFSLVIQADGKIVVCGWDRQGTTYRQVLVRYNDNGSLDTDFGNGGKIILSLGGNNEDPPRLALSPDGKILICNRRNVSGDRRAVVAQFLSNGIPDSTFGVNGQAINGISGVDVSAKSIKTTPAGKILVSGISEPVNNQEDFFLLQLNADGSPDSSFATNGFAIFNFQPGSREIFYGMVLLPDGKVLIHGQSLQNNFSDLVMVRYLATGSIDSTFGESGIISYRRNGLFQTIDELLMQSDGKLVGAGNSAGSGLKAWAIRFKSSGSSVGIADEGKTLHSLIAYPNPAASQATLRYALELQEPVSIHLLDMTGRTVHSFFDAQARPAGMNEELLDIPTSLSTGLYLLRIFTPSQSTAVRMQLSGQ